MSTKRLRARSPSGRAGTARHLAVLVALVSCSIVSGASAAPLADGVPVRGWIILSKSEPDALATIAAAPAYGINHLELSHLVVHDLREIKDDARRDLVNRLTDEAHAKGISEVVLWDHALYKLDYYPEQFRTGPDKTIDLDNPAFWEWLKADYRAMLDRVPKADGIILTFIETGARAERQHSLKLKTNQEKLAAVVNAVADVVIGERKLNLYARTFSYSHAEYANVIGAIKLFARPEIRLMMKETPHDFFLTHPNDRYAGTIARPTLMEFDIAGEFHGQGIVATTWPEYVLRRWRDLAKRPHIIGYTARTDRYGDTRLVGRPEEINLAALKRAALEPQVTAEQVYDDFIAERYGKAALPAVKAAFKNAFDIISSTIYTLGLNLANHSELNYEPAVSSYVLHNTGKWVDPPIGYVGHGVNREFHYWRDLVNHLAPTFVKEPSNRQWNEVPWVQESGWITPGEGMTEEYLRYVLREKDHGVTLAEESMRHIESAQAALKPADYEQLRHHFQRTLLTARLHRASSAAYFGFRVWLRGDPHRTPFVTQTVERGLAGMKEVGALIRAYPVKPAVGQWDWTKDADQAEKYFNWITKDGFPKETRGFPSPHAGKTFPYGPR
jgi:hypothetical protein